MRARYSTREIRFGDSSAIVAAAIKIDVVQLAEWCIKLHGVSGVHTMLDPFLGIGNSAVAAQRCGVKNFIGFEIDGKYLAEAKRRLNI